MESIDLKTKINNLIRLNKEGLYWDFKSRVHEDMNDLIYDIMCLANCSYEGDRYLIFGVSENNGNFDIIGIDDSQKYKIQSDNLQNKIYTFDFAGDNYPEIQTEFIEINEKVLGVLIIKNSENKPYFLDNLSNKKSIPSDLIMNHEEKKELKTLTQFLNKLPLNDDINKKNVVNKIDKFLCELTKNELYSHHIYTRRADSNTNRSKSASYKEIERMWKDHFGINSRAEIVFKRLLYLRELWTFKEDEISQEVIIFNKYNPEFSIEIKSSNLIERDDYLDIFYNSILFGKIYYKYYSTIIYESSSVFLEKWHIIPTPSFEHLGFDENGKEIGFYYYDLKSFEGLLFVLLFNEFNLKKVIKFPHIIFVDSITKENYIDYLKGHIKDNFWSNIDIKNDVEVSKEINVEMMYKIVKGYEKSLM